MKKYLVFLILLFLFGKVYAVTENYSDWSSEYPEGVNELLIRKENRYLWYKEVISDVQYLMKEKAGDRIIDYNTRTKIESDGESIIKPEPSISRVIHGRNTNYAFKSSDVELLYIKANKDINIYELEIYINGEKYNYETNSDNIKLNDNDYDYYIDSFNELEIKFDKKYDINDIVIKLYYINDVDITVSFRCHIYDIYFNDFKASNESKDVLVINKDNLKSKLVQFIPVYSYTDIVYKTYRIEKEYTSEYYSELDGYIKDESTMKTFYRYITNKYIIVDGYGNVVKDMGYCAKNFCALELLDEPEPEKVENPKTGDFIQYSFLILFASLIVISLLLYIFYRKIANNKSSFVESL